MTVEWTYEVVYVKDGRLRFEVVQYGDDHEPAWTQLPFEVQQFINGLPDDCEWCVYVLKGMESMCSHYSQATADKKDEEEKDAKKAKNKKKQALAVLLPSNDSRWDEI